MHFPIRVNPTRLGASSLLLTESLPVGDLTDAHMHRFYFCGEPAEPTALIGFEQYGTDALLRSLVVSRDQRARGIGKRLVTHAEAEARAVGVTSMYLLTTTAEKFFASLGYAPADRERAPAGIRASREFSSLCPASAAFMVKRL